MKATDAAAIQGQSLARLGRRRHLRRLRRGEECGAKRRRVLVAIGRHLRHRPAHDRLERLADRRAHGAQAGHRIDRVSRDDRLRGRAGEWRRAREHLVDDAAERVDVAAAVYALARALLGAHVLHRADGDPRLGDLLVARRHHRPRDPEVREQRVPRARRRQRWRVAGEQHVAGLDVAMHDAARVRIGQRIRDLLGDADRVVERQLSFPCDA